ncbi:MAG: hypothetical protein U1E28_11920 [Beijerinckiaceae bacterium]
MLQRIRQLKAGWIAVALYALTAVTVGFAHKPASLPRSVELAAYALPDGTLPPICAHDENAPAGHAAAAQCDACLLTSAPGLAPVAQAFLPVRLGAVVAPVATSRDFVAAAPRYAPSSRGPPLA